MSAGVITVAGEADETFSESQSVTSRADEGTTSDASGSEENIRSEPVPAPSSIVDVSESATHGFMETPFSDYTVTEGLLLIAVVFLSLAGIMALFRGRM